MEKEGKDNPNPSRYNLRDRKPQDEESSEESQFQQILFFSHQVQESRVKSKDQQLGNQQYQQLRKTTLRPLNLTLTGSDGSLREKLPQLTYNAARVCHSLFYIPYFLSFRGN